MTAWRSGSALREAKEAKGVDGCVEEVNEGDMAEGEVEVMEDWTSEKWSRRTELRKLYF